MYNGVWMYSIYFILNRPNVPHLFVNAMRQNLSCPRMMGFIDFFHGFATMIAILLSRLLHVTQHVLNRTCIRPIGNQVCCKRMTKGMRRNFFRDSRIHRRFFSSFQKPCRVKRLPDTFTNSACSSESVLSNLSEFLPHIHLPNVQLVHQWEGYVPCPPHRIV